jgi:hypothetical protein
MEFPYFLVTGDTFTLTLTGEDEETEVITVTATHAVTLRRWLDVVHLFNNYLPLLMYLKRFGVEL